MHLFRKIALLAFASLLVSACANLNGFVVKRGEDGLYRAKPGKFEGPLWNEAEAVLRDEKDQVITDEKKANETLQRLKSIQQLFDNYGLNECNSKALYRAKVAQFAAVAALKAEAWGTALKKLDDAEAECGQITNFTAQDYFRALALQQSGKPEAARAAANKFLDFAASAQPVGFEQGNGPDVENDFKDYLAETKDFATYRANAQAFVKGGAALPLPRSAQTEMEVAKYYPNMFFRPGGNRRVGLGLLPTIASGGPLGSAFGLTGYYSFGKFGLGAGYINSSTTGSYVAVKVRESVFESAKRDLDVEVFVAGSTRKRFSYVENNHGYENVQVLQNAFEPGVGVGATKRIWSPAFGFTGELTAYDNQVGESAISGSLYSFYDLNRLFSLNAGWIQDRPMAAVSFLWLQLGYNLREQSLDVLVQGLTF